MILWETLHSGINFLSCKYLLAKLKTGKRLSLQRKNMLDPKKCCSKDNEDQLELFWLEENNWNPWIKLEPLHRGSQHNIQYCDDLWVMIMMKVKRMGQIFTLSSLVWFWSFNLSSSAIRSAMVCFKVEFLSEIFSQFWLICLYSSARSAKISAAFSVSSAICLFFCLQNLANSIQKRHTDQNSK